MTLKKLERTMKRTRKARDELPCTDDPILELRLLVNQHRAATRARVAIENMCKDKEARQDIPARGLKKGDKIPCPLPDDVRHTFLNGNKAADLQIGALERRIDRALRPIPIYDVFLRHVFGLGPVVSAYLVSTVDIRKADKPSKLHRYCGLAVINGRLERRESGRVSAYNSDLRTRLHQAASAMRKNASSASLTPEMRAERKRIREAAKEEGVKPKMPHIDRTCTSKYLQAWEDHKHRILSSDRVEKGKIVPLHDGEPAGKAVSAQGFADNAGWHKAMRLLLEDVYVVWRALEGLPVWPDYHAAKLGYAHGGRRIQVDEPRMLTVEEALELVGDPGKISVAEAAE